MIIHKIGDKRYMFTAMYLDNIQSDI